MTPTPVNEISGRNGETLHRELFALSDEQILEIDPEPQDVEVSQDSRPAHRRDSPTSAAGAVAQAFRPEDLDATTPTSNARATRDSHWPFPSDTPGPTDRNTLTPEGVSYSSTKHDASKTDHGSRNTTHDSATPPQWLADRMSDPQYGAEARELWNSSQLARGSEQARQEAAAFREVFAKPDDARAAAQRARVLDDIDRAYFTGDATQRAQLAASMLREDPAAFREMVFAGLRALEQAGQSTSSPNSATDPATAPVAQAFRPEGLDANAIGTSATSKAAPQGIPTIGTQPSDRKNLTPEGVSYSVGANTSTVGAQHAAPQLGKTSASEAHLAAYTTFERSANEDLERTVGSAIDRTLDQALPLAQPLLAVHGVNIASHDRAQARVPVLRERLAATIRQDIEKSLQGDRQLGEQVAQILSARRFDNEARASVVRLIGERAQQLVPGAAKRVLSEWTQTTLSAHRNQRDRTDAATTSREVEPARPAGGPASGTAPRAAATAAASQRSSNPGTRRPQESGAPRNSRGVDYRHLSDEQILDL